MKTRLFLSFPSAFPKLSFSYRLPFRVQRYSCNITADLNRCYNSVKKWVNIKFHVYESGLFRVLLSYVSVCFSASSSCASQLRFCVLLSIFAFFLPGFDSAAFGS